MNLRAALDRRWIQEAYSIAAQLGSLLPLPRRRRFALLVTGLRRTQTAVSRWLARRLLAPWKTADGAAAWRANRIGWARYAKRFGAVGKSPALTSALLLKEPGADGEKGVLYSAFEFNWMKLVANHDLRAFLDEYYLVGASSWSPTDHAMLGALQMPGGDPAFIGVSHPDDFAQYSVWAPNVRPIPVMASDLTDPAMFDPVPHARRGIDLLMVAHFAHWKRHWLLFEALKRMPRDLNVVLIGRNADGRTERHLLDDARARGVRQDLTVLKNLEIDEVARHQCDAKVSLAFSKREGACISVAESLFADSPVAMMHDAHMGSRTYINAATGRFVRRAGLHRVLLDMIGGSDRFRPREWAAANISAERTSRRLNALLREHALASGRPWTRDIVPLCRRYVPRYLNDSDRLRMQPALKRLQRGHGIVLDDFVSERAAAARNALRAG